jgi:hypothetical protein
MLNQMMNDETVDGVWAFYGMNLIGLGLASDQADLEILASCGSLGIWKWK